MPPRPATVLIVDDQAPFRTVARTVVGMTPGFEVVGEAEDGGDAVERAAALVPDIVLMDINMPTMSGIEATRLITGSRPETKVILLSTYSEADLPAEARDCGAATYVHKEDFEPSVLLDVWDSGQPVG